MRELLSSGGILYFAHNAARTTTLSDVLTLSTLMSTTADILFLTQYLYTQLLIIKYAFNP